MTALPIGRPRFVSVDEAIAWHETAIAQYGGSPGLRDRGLLESALAMPRQSFGGEFVHQFPFEMAAAYAFHLAKNHSFVDGNKRIALMCCGAFLRMNGWDLVSKEVEVADAILDLISGSRDKTAFAEWLCSHCRPRPSMELRDFFQSVTWQSVIDAMKASVARPKGAEFDATLQEAVQAIPMLQGLNAEASAAASQGDQSALDRCAAQMGLLMHLYRVAEDMGYEW